VHQRYHPNWIFWPISWPSWPTKGLLMRHTIEEKMMLLKEQKLQLYKAILEEGVGGGGAGLSRDDFEFLMG